MKKVIELRDVSKRFARSSQHQDTFVGTLANSFGSLFSPKESVPDYHWALKDISFSVEQGEILGVIGSNGSGKSTLLRVLSKIILPTQGEVRVSGSVSSLLDLGSGFHPDLTGRENIYMNGTLLGMSTHEVNLRLNEIIDFSGIGDFIDSPVKHYSNGMFLRLGFSIAAHLVSDIILIDEVLAVGDAEFQYRSLQKIRELADSGKTLIIVSHGMNSILNLCNKAMLLREGQMVAKDSPHQIISTYLSETRDFIDNDLLNETVHKAAFRANPVDGIKGINLLKARVMVDNRDDDGLFFIADEVGITLDLSLDEAFPDLQVMIQLTRNHDSHVITTTSELLDLHPQVTLNQKGRFIVRCQFPKFYFNRGLYSASICIKSSLAFHFENQDILKFFIQLPKLKTRDDWLKDSNFNSGPMAKWDMSPV